MFAVCCPTYVKLFEDSQVATEYLAAVILSQSCPHEHRLVSIGVLDDSV